jgi:hypothetical protein
MFGRPLMMACVTFSRRTFSTIRRAWCCVPMQRVIFAFQAVLPVAYPVPTDRWAGRKDAGCYGQPPLAHSAHSLHGGGHGI